MKTLIRRYRFTALLGLIAVTGLVAVPHEAVGQEHGFEVKGLLEVPLTGVPGRQAVMVTVEVFPGETEPRHTHPGDEFIYLLEGEGTVLVDGEPITLAPDRVVHVRPGQEKAIRNSSDTHALRVLAVLIVDKNLPVVEFTEPVDRGSGRPARDD